MDFAALPPEINSGRMFAGAGSGPMLRAAGAWDSLAAELSSAAGTYNSVVSSLTGGAWLGPASVSMAGAAATFMAWMNTTAEQVRQTARHARSATAAYEAAFAATVPPSVIEHNRSVLMSLVATNVVGQNTPAIAATEADYAEMWAQDATAMHAYASDSAAASALTPFTGPPQNTNPAGVGTQAAAVGQAVGTAAGLHSTSVLSQLVSTVPNMLQALALGDPTGAGADTWLNFGSGLTFVTSGVLFILGPLLTDPIIAGALPASLTGLDDPGQDILSNGGVAGIGAPRALISGSTGAFTSLRRSEVSAGLGRSGLVGGLSVPPSWATPASTRVATALPESSLLSVAQAEPYGLGTGYGAMLPTSLMAAAAGGGGAAGGGWAATRGGATEKRGSDGTPTRYAPPASLLPGEVRDGGLPEHTNARGLNLDQRAQRDVDPSGQDLRDEISDLRKQIADLAMERDLLMRSAALWAREALGR